MTATRTGFDDGEPSEEETGTPMPTGPGVTLSATALTVTEEDRTGGSYRVALRTQPSASVTVTVAGHSGTDVTATPSTLTFTTSNWFAEQRVTVTAGADTDLYIDSVTLTHTAESSDSGYSGITIDSVTVTVSDNDDTGVKGVAVTPATLNVVEGSSATYTVNLNSSPTGNVTVDVSSSHPTVATVSPAELNFTTMNWKDPQTVTVTGVNTPTDTTVLAINNARGGGYTPYSAAVTVTIEDNETAGVNVSTPTLSVTEEDTAGATYTLGLRTPPSASVTVTVAGHSGTNVTATPSTLTFTTSNWDTAQTVTVTAGSDADTAYDTVTLTHTASSTDIDYNGITIGDVTVTVIDNDTTPDPNPNPNPNPNPTPPIGGGGGGGGGFGPALDAPKFVDGFRTSRPLDENARVGDAVGDPVTATHPTTSRSPTP